MPVLLKVCFFARRHDFAVHKDARTNAGMAGQKARSTGTDYQQPMRLRLAALCYKLKSVKRLQQPHAAGIRYIDIAGGVHGNSSRRVQRKTTASRLVTEGASGQTDDAKITVTVH
jgi:hypothetical protein